MAYGLIITEAASSIVAKMGPDTHERFVYAMLDLGTDPHSQGHSIGSYGPTVTERAMALGADGLIIYIVDDIAQTVRIVNVIWLE
jgi:hypothetical protein